MQLTDLPLKQSPFFRSSQCNSSIMTPAPSSMLKIITIIDSESSIFCTKRREWIVKSSSHLSSKPLFNP
ncbi:hypothetical protein CICLE_v10023219mg [Citrus x clementina]|uniref:Uncharacterized protein n=1 Tax=Citrus clementina TaxID=85681 RepID=V4TT94_CITCL|nr:hypothetical protein CICLE_v10023219mg [Citrus x clementina]